MLRESPSICPVAYAIAGLALAVGVAGCGPRRGAKATSDAALAMSLGYERPMIEDRLDLDETYPEEAWKGIRDSRDQLAYRKMTDGVVWDWELLDEIAAKRFGKGKAKASKPKKAAKKVPKKPRKKAPKKVKERKKPAPPKAEAEEESGRGGRRGRRPAVSKKTEKAEPEEPAEAEEAEEEEKEEVEEEAKPKEEPKKSRRRRGRRRRK